MSRRLTLSNTLETAGDPCAALAVDLVVQPGETVDTLFLLAMSRVNRWLGRLSKD